ncbi:MAG: Na(+)/H(+) antiporter subunit B [Hyphomicrobiaceae bacterium]
MRLDVILRVSTKLIIPFILVFAFYVHFHGDYGPGGGFQAGVILAGAVILYSIIFGVDAAQRVVPQWLVAFMVPLGVFVYAGTGAISFLYGLNYMDYTGLGHDIKHSHHLGILLVEAGVIITVAGTMTAIFYAFVERGR